MTHKLKQNPGALDNFRIIQALCRIGLGSGGPAFRYQVERLINALRLQEKQKEAAALEELLRSSESEVLLKPSRVVQ